MVNICFERFILFTLLRFFSVSDEGKNRVWATLSVSFCKTACDHSSTLFFVGRQFCADNNLYRYKYLYVHCAMYMNVYLYLMCVCIGIKTNIAQVNGNSVLFRFTSLSMSASNEITLDLRGSCTRTYTLEHDIYSLCDCVRNLRNRNLVFLLVLLVVFVAENKILAASPHGFTKGKPSERT